MGGVGSGGHNRLSDAEKKRRGTFKVAESEAAYNENAGRKVITGPWLAEIPDAAFPLTEVGQKEYDRVVRILFDGGKLTVATHNIASMYASLHQKIYADTLNGKLSGRDVDRMARLLNLLKITEEAPSIGSSSQRNKFEGSGFSIRSGGPRRLR